MTDVRSRGDAESRDVAGLGLPLPRQPADPPVPVANTVELDRLLRLAGLTPAQAVEVGADLLAAVAGRCGPDVDGDQVIDARVVIGADGRVVLRRDFDRPVGDASTAGARSQVTVVAVLGDIARAARLRARPAGPEAGRLLAR